MEFECSNKAGCVPRSQLCDGEFDCTDGSDELSCGLYRTRRGRMHPLYALVFGQSFFKANLGRVLLLVIKNVCNKECVILLVIKDV